MCGVADGATTLTTQPPVGCRAPLADCQTHPAAERERASERERAREGGAWREKLGGERKGERERERRREKEREREVCERAKRERAH